MSSLDKDKFSRIIDKLSPKEKALLAYYWPQWARAEQLAPKNVPWSTWLVCAGRGWGKALALDTPIPTPTGWTTMRDIQPDDELFDEMGKVCRVTFATEVQHNRVCYDVVFSDGSVITADAEHRWLTWDKAARKAHGRAKNPTIHPQVRTTFEIAASLMNGKEVNHAVQTAEPLILPDTELPIDPYVFGVWLGDGSSACAEITGMDEEIFDQVEKAGYVFGKPRRAGGRAITVSFKNPNAGASRGDNGRYLPVDGSPNTELRRLGVVKNKHIPVLYARASAPQRLALLQGLMDTDGACCPGGHVEFVSVSDRLARDVFELVCSLGFKPTMKVDRARLNGVDCGPRYRISWTPHHPVFRLSRKLDRQHTGKSQAARNKRRFIVEVRPRDSVPVRCIQVDSPNSLFLVGRAMIPTHNTRVGAEWVRSVAKPGARIAIVAPTAADARDVCIQGESGLLSCCPPWDIPEYQPSLRRVVWKNGAIATTYSADEPERLRGPQHTHAWCLAGDTKVLMGDGSEKNLADIRIGEMVQTRVGPKRCVGSALTRRSASVYRLFLVDGRSIIGTAEHPVWIDGRGFVPIGSITKGMFACVTPVSSGAVRFGIVTEGTTNARLGFTGPSGSLCTVQYQKGTTSTTSTVTSLTTGSKTLSCSPMGSIAEGISKKSLVRSGILPSLARLRLLAKIDKKELKRELLFASYARANSGAQQNIRQNSVRLDVSKRPEVEHLSQSVGFANIAESNTLPPNEYRNTVQGGAIVAQQNSELEHSSNAIYSAHNAKKYSDQREPMQGFANANVPSTFTLEIVSVEKLAKRIDVYDIAVKDAHEFFANGILVHNCDEVGAWRYPETWDMLAMGLRLGDNPRTVVTTTPRQTPLMKIIRQSSGVIITRGRTLDNVDNLAPTFMQTMMDRYGGTRLARQELDGEDLWDEPGALWDREVLDETRQTRTQMQYARVVVSVDPAGSNTADSDETGIIVAAKGMDGHGYVLADLSGKYSPDQWARKAIAAYEQFDADRIIAEKNQGGDMVAHTLKTVNPEIPLRLVHASRGKIARAEPVAALYEQRKIHHVGCFGPLEDQMCTWVQGMKSPDRLDALVWALTELFIGKGDFCFG